MQTFIPVEAINGLFRSSGVSLCGALNGQMTVMYLVESACKPVLDYVCLFIRR